MCTAADLIQVALIQREEDEVGAVRVQGMRGPWGHCVFFSCAETVPKLGSLGSIGASNSSTVYRVNFTSAYFCDLVQKKILRIEIFAK